MPITSVDAPQSCRAARRPGKSNSTRAMTLVEVLIATSLSAIVMTSILTAFLMLGRSGANMANYVQMEKEVRSALQRFGEDVRMARSLTTVSATQIRLAVPHAYDSGSDNVTYTYDSVAKTLTRLGPDPTTGAANTTTVMVRNVQNCDFRRWMKAMTGPATSDASTYQLQIRLIVERREQTAAATSNLVVSARFVLRNYAHS